TAQAGLVPTVQPGWSDPRALLAPPDTWDRPGMTERMLSGGLEQRGLPERARQDRLDRPARPAASDRRVLMERTASAGPDRRAAREPPVPLVLPDRKAPPVLPGQKGMPARMGQAYTERRGQRVQGAWPASACQATKVRTAGGWSVPPDRPDQWELPARQDRTGRTAPRVWTGRTVKTDCPTWVQPGRRGPPDHRAAPPARPEPRGQVPPARPDRRARLSWRTTEKTARVGPVPRDRPGLKAPPGHPAPSERPGLPAQPERPARTARTGRTENQARTARKELRDCKGRRGRLVRPTRCCGTAATCGCSQTPPR